jgi:glycoside/pentoside/hexuronide:cation symporter, GPH family
MTAMSGSNQKLSFIEKAGYGAGDAAANIVFLTMILFQTSFYTEVFGIGPEIAATILLVARLWDAVVDPLVGALADRTRTRWGAFRPWILATAIPWGVAMVLAYSTPRGWSTGAMIAYAAVTNVFLMSIYSMNNVPYAALGGVMSGDVNERAKLNSFRFVVVNIMQFMVAGFTLPLVAKFAVGHDRQFGWQATSAIGACVCLVLFTITFLTTRERIQPVARERGPLYPQLSSVVRSSPWVVMFAVTFLQFAALAFRGGALYGYYHHFADKAAMYDWLRQAGLVASSASSGGILDMLGFVVHGDQAHASGSNVADVFNSIVNMIGTAMTTGVLLLSPALSRHFGKKAVSVAGFGAAGIATLCFTLLTPKQVEAMVILTALNSLCFAPTVALLWAIYADVVDYLEWTTGRRLTGIVFATIGFALKTGLAFGSAGFLWVMAGLFNYDATTADSTLAREGLRFCAGGVVGASFLMCSLLLSVFKLNKRLTLQMVEELPSRRIELAAAAGGS